MSARPPLTPPGRPPHPRGRFGVAVGRPPAPLDPPRAAAVLVHDRAEEPPVEAVEPARVHPLAVEGLAGDGLDDPPLALDLRVVAHAPQQAGHDPRRAPP